MDGGTRIVGWYGALFALVGASSIPAFAQDARAQAPVHESAVDAGESSAEATIIVSGARSVQRRSLQHKREAAVILDAITYEETGPLADISVADILERITGVTADRFKGNANEVSLRGLGPTLTLAALNGQEISTAGPDRSVAFQQFPAELLRGVIVRKTPRADFIEGAIAGTIELQTVRPLEVEGRQARAELRASYSPQDDRIAGRAGLGYRASVSFADQWTTGVGDLGFSLGLQHSDQAAPEDYYTTSSAFVPCSSAASSPADLTAAGSVLNCDLIGAPRHSDESSGALYFAAPTRGYRILLTEEERDSALATLQWLPSPDLKFTLDGQYSVRRSTEDRHTLVLVEGLRGVAPILVGDGANGYDRGALVRYSGNSNVESQFEDRQRNEDYLGASGEIAWNRDRLALSFAASYSASHRTETQKATRLRSDERVAYTFDGTRDAVPAIHFTDFDIADPERFLSLAPSSAYARRRFVTDRRDTIRALRFDFDYVLGAPFVRQVSAGARLALHRRTNDNAANSDLNTLAPLDGLSPAQLIRRGNTECRTGFPASGFMRSADTTIRSWAVFDNDCLFRIFTGGDDALPFPSETRDHSDVDVRERSIAAYLLAEFAGSLGRVSFFGDIGVRYVRTEVDSAGFRLPVTVTIDTASDEYVVAPLSGGAVSRTRLEGGYGYWLPSANAALELGENALLRLAAYRAIARSGIELFGAGVELEPITGTGTDAVAITATAGNPGLRPMDAWNLDASLEFYLGQDTALSVAPYAKWLRGAVIDAVASIPSSLEALTIVDGAAPVRQVYPVSLIAPANDARTRHLYGVELQASHAFTYLPQPLDGFGLRAGYNLALSDFEYPDTSALAPYLEPANLIGLSRHSLHAMIYWERSGFSASASYRYRSSYFKPNSNTNRSVRGSGHLSLTVQYDLSPTLQLRAQVLNVTGTRDIFYKGVPDNVTEVSESGPIYFLGLRSRL